MPAIIKRDTTVEFEVSPEDIARMFCDLTDLEQASFFRWVAYKFGKFERAGGGIYQRDLIGIALSVEDRLDPDVDNRPARLWIEGLKEATEAD